MLHRSFSHVLHQLRPDSWGLKTASLPPQWLSSPLNHRVANLIDGKTLWWKYWFQRLFRSRMGVLDVIDTNIQRSENVSSTQTQREADKTSADSGGVLYRDLLNMLSKVEDICQASDKDCYFRRTMSGLWRRTIISKSSRRVIEWPRAPGWARVTSRASSRTTSSTSDPLSELEDSGTPDWRELNCSEMSEMWPSIKMSRQLKCFKGNVAKFNRIKFSL